MSDTELSREQQREQDAWLSSQKPEHREGTATVMLHPYELELLAEALEREAGQIGGPGDLEGMELSLCRAAEFRWAARRARHG